MLQDEDFLSPRGNSHDGKSTTTHERDTTAPRSRTTDQLQRLHEPIGIGVPTWPDASACYELPFKSFGQRSAPPAPAPFQKSGQDKSNRERAREGGSEATSRVLFAAEGQRKPGALRRPE